MSITVLRPGALPAARPLTFAWTLTALFGLSLGGTLFVAYLTYLELFVILAICPWCVSIAIATGAILLLTVGELRGSS